MSKFHLKRWQIASYAAPSIPNSALGLPIAVYLPAFYAEQAGLSVAMVGWIFMLARFWDVFTDPVLGIVSDRYSTRWGRRRHWIVLSVPIMLLSAWQIFMPPQDVGIAHLLIWMFVLYIGYTLLTISHISWGAELTPDYHERSRVQGWREFALVLGMTTVLALPALIEIAATPAATPPESAAAVTEQALSAPAPAVAPAAANAGEMASGEGATCHVEEEAVGRDKIAAMGWFIIILLPITVFIAVFFVGERKVGNHPQIQWKELWGVLQRNKAVRRLIIVDTIAGFGPSVSGVLYIWYISYYVGMGDWASRILLLYFVAAFMGIPLWIQLSYRIGKHKALATAFLFASVILITYLFAGNAPFWLVLVLNFLFGLAYGAGPFLLRSMMADVRDYDRLETGQERTGLYFSLLTMTSKVGAALGMGISLVLLGVLGFDPNLGGCNTPLAINSVALLFVFFPMAVYLLGAMLIWNFPLDQAEQERLRKAIEEQHGGEHDGDHGAFDQFAGTSPPRGEIEDQQDD